MTKHQKLPTSAKAIATTALVALVLAARLPELACSATPLSGFLGTVICHALELTPSLAPAVLQALQVLGFHYGDSALCTVHLLVSCFPLLRFLAGVA